MSPVPLRRYRSVVALLLLPLFASGCLAPQFEVPRDEVDRLVRLPFDQRGQHIRAVQRFSTAEDIPPAPPFVGTMDAAPQDGAPVESAAAPAPLAPVYTAWGDPYYASPWYRGGVWVSAGESRLYPSGTLAGNGGQLDSKGSGGWIPDTAASRGKASRQRTGETAAALMMAVVVVGIGLAASEGARYDGWIAVHQQHPLHVIGRGGEHRIVPLDQLAAGTIQPGESVVIVAHEGAGTWLRGHAPLNREGLTYQFGGGFGDTQLWGQQVASGGSGELAIGGFFSPWLGILGRGRVLSGESERGDFITVRGGIELQALPIDLRWFHFGGFLGSSIEWAQAGNVNAAVLDESRSVWSVGAMAEFTWRTRLALYVRYGFDRARLARDEALWTQGMTFGLSIY